MSVAFADDTAVVRRRMSWEERSKLVRKQFPSIDNLDWRQAFNEDEDLFARILRDILRADAAEPGRPGPRPAVEYEDGINRMRQMMGQDYSYLPFAEALACLLHWQRGVRHKQAGKLSLTTLARKTKISRSKCYRLLMGVEEPTGEEMEAVAGAFNKDPDYFVEWRTAYVIAAVHERLNQVPETTVGFYRRLKVGP